MSRLHGALASVVCKSSHGESRIQDAGVTEEIMFRCPSTTSSHGESRIQDAGVTEEIMFRCPSTTSSHEESRIQDAGVTEEIMFRCPSTTIIGRLEAVSLCVIKWCGGPSDASPSQCMPARPPHSLRSQLSEIAESPFLDHFPDPLPPAPLTSSFSLPISFTQQHQQSWPTYPKQCSWLPSLAISLPRILSFA